MVDAKILFVDDEAPVLEGYRRLLQSGVHREHGSRRSARSGGMIRTTGPYAVVVSDMRMPGMNGAEFLAKVREKYAEHGPDTC